MPHKIDDLTIGALLYRKARSIRPAIVSLICKGEFKDLEEVTPKPHFGPHYLFTQEEARIMFNHSPAKHLLEVGEKLNKLYGEGPVAEAAPAPSSSPKTAPKHPLMVIKQVGRVAFQGLFSMDLSLGVDGEKYIVANDLPGILGLSDRAFNKRIDRRFASWVAVTTTQSTSGARQIRLLNIKAIPGVLYTITPSRIASHLRPVLVKMQDELTWVLGAYVFEGNASNPNFSQAERDAARAKQDHSILESLNSVMQMVEGVIQTNNSLLKSMDSFLKMQAATGSPDIVGMMKGMAPGSRIRMDTPGTDHTVSVAVHDTSSGVSLNAIHGRYASKITKSQLSSLLIEHGIRDNEEYTFKSHADNRTTGKTQYNPHVLYRTERVEDLHKLIAPLVDSFYEKQTLAAQAKEDKRRAKADAKIKRDADKAAKAKAKEKAVN